MPIPSYSCTAFRIGDAGNHRHVGEGAIPVVVEQVIREGIVGDENICESVVIVVRKCDTHSLTGVPRNVGRLRDVSKRSIPIVAIEDVRRSAKLIGSTVGWNSFDMAKRGRLDIVIEVVHDQEIKKTVIVVVKPSSRHCPGLAETGNLTADAGLSLSRR